MPPARTRLALALLAAALPAAAHAGTLYDNTALASGGTEAASGATRLAVAFTTDATGDAALRATLKATETAGSDLSVAVYTDTGLLQPTALVTSLAELSDATDGTGVYGNVGLALAANAKYWLVADATSGSLAWSWAASFTAAGEWARSTDDGATWFNSDIYPLQFAAATLDYVPGDANLDGTVGFSDLAALAVSYGSATGATFATGDTDGDGDVDFADLAALAVNYTGAGALTAAQADVLGESVVTDWSLALSAVPEPTALAAGAVAFGLLSRRARRRK